VLLPIADTDALREAAAGYQRVWLVHDFDPAEADWSAQDSLRYLRDFSIEQRFEFAGVHVVLATLR
jgi:hypothetical protein